MSNGKQRKAEVFRHTVRPGISMPLFLKTLPGATCLLRRAEDTDPERQVKIFADDDGIICVHVRPSVEAENIARFEIECSADGRVKHYPLELRASHKQTPEMPFPARQRPARKKRGTIRPALSEEEALRLSEEELRERGYPPRPDREALGPIKTWLRSVSVPMTMVEPRLVTNTGVIHQLLQTTNPIWSGFVIRGGPFNQVWGDWNVPNIIFGEANIQDWSAFWVGIDGYGTNDLVQAGTEQNILDLDFGFGTFSFTSYYAWTQFLPQQKFEQTISNISVNPGDEMSFLVWLSNSEALFFVQNISANEITVVQTPFGKTVVGATEAEWIMERPTVGNGPADLAGYGAAIMKNVRAVDPQTSYSYDGIGYFGEPSLQSVQLAMTNGTDTLSTVSPLGADSMFFFWTGFH